jgi:hypothetical protein
MWLHHLRLRFIQGSPNIAASWFENPEGTIDNGENFGDQQYSIPWR